MVTNRSFNLNNETGRPVARNVTFDKYWAEPSVHDVHLEHGTDTTVDQVPIYNKVSRLNLFFKVFYEIFTIFIQ